MRVSLYSPLLGILVGCLLATSCSGLTGTTIFGDAALVAVDAFHDLPDDFDELLDISRRLFREDARVADMSRALMAACKATGQVPDHPEANHLVSRTCLWLVDYGEAPICYDARRERAEVVDCVYYGTRAAEGDRRNAEYHYYLALNMGIQLQEANIASAGFSIPKLIETLEMVIEMDRSLDRGGALRVLAAVYLKAPPWPTGVGDEEKALELLGEAVTDYPDHPLNHYFYAEALLEDEEYDQAAASLARCRSLLDPNRFFWRADRWRIMADKLEQRLKEERE